MKERLSEAGSRPSGKEEILRGLIRFVDDHRCSKLKNTSSCIHNLRTIRPVQELDAILQVPEFGQPH
eukprot:254036-Hanusia_phi.AAC.1